MGWIGSIWLRIGTSGGLLWTRWWTFGLHKTQGSSWVAAQLTTSQGLSSMTEWVKVMWSPCCLCICVSPPINSEPIVMKVGMCMPPEAISAAYFINPSHQSVCLYVYPSIVARQQLGKKTLPR
jgi:hypothetical protein